MSKIWQEETIELRGVTLAARRWGDREAPTKIVALHGWLDNAASFDVLAPLMGGAIDLVALDLLGHGRSPGRGAMGAYHFVDWIDVVVAAADGLGWEEFSLLGHSMGAAISLLTAAVIPKRVERVAIIDGLGPWSDDDGAVVKRVRQALKSEKKLRQRQSRRYTERQEMIEALGRARPGVSTQALAGLLDRMVATDEGERLYFDLDEKLKASSRIRLTERQVLAFLEAIECPVLLVRPDEGWPVKEELMASRLAAIEDLEVVQVQGQHHVHLEAPDRFAAKMKRFLLAGGQQ